MAPELIAQSIGCHRFTFGGEPDWLSSGRSECRLVAIGGESAHPARPQAHFHQAHAPRHLALDRPLTNAESARNLCLRNVLEFSEEHDLATARRERNEGFREKLDLFRVNQRRARIGLIFQDVQLGPIPQSIRARSPGPTHGIDYEVPRDLKKERLCRGDRPGKTRAPNPQVGFLHNVIEIANLRERSTQISP